MTNTTYNKLMQYKNYEFSTGCYTGEDYKIFERLYIRHLKAVCKENNWIFVQANKNHYCMSAFIKDSNNRFIYLSISDVRFFKNEWCNNVLIRTASDEKDYHGGSNHYTTLQAFVHNVQRLFNYQ